MSTPYPGDTDWPSDFQGCTFTGTYVGLDGAPVNGDVDPNGYVQFICPVEVLLSFGTYKVILPRSLKVQLDAHGHFSILVPATDDPDISPIGWTYTIHEAFSGGRSYSVEAPLGQTVDITRASPVPDAKGNPVVRGPRGVDGLVQGASLNGDLLPVDDASDVVLDGYVLDLRQNLADVPNPAEALLHLGVTGDLVTRDASEFDAAGAAAAVDATLQAEIDTINNANNAGPQRLQMVATVLRSITNSPSRIEGMSVRAADKGLNKITGLVIDDAALSAASQIVMPAGSAGQWELSAQVGITPSNSDRYWVSIYVNGAEAITVPRYLSTATMNATSIVIPPFELTLAVGDTIGLWARCDTGAGTGGVIPGTPVRSYLRMKKVGT